MTMSDPFGAKATGQAGRLDDNPEPTRPAVTMTLEAESHVHALSSILTWNKMHKGQFEAAMDLLPARRADWLIRHKGQWRSRAIPDAENPLIINIVVWCDTMELAHDLMGACK